MAASVTTTVSHEQKNMVNLKVSFLHLREKVFPLFEFIFHLLKARAIGLQFSSKSLQISLVLFVPLPLSFSFTKFILDPYAFGYLRERVPYHVIHVSVGEFCVEFVSQSFIVNSMRIEHPLKKFDGIS